MRPSDFSAEEALVLTIKDFGRVGLPELRRSLLGPVRIEYVLLSCLEGEQLLLLFGRVSHRLVPEKVYSKVPWLGLFRKEGRLLFNSVIPALRRTQG